MKDTDLHRSLGVTDAIEKEFCRQARTSVEVDVERYQAFLDDPCLTPEQREEMIGALWTIITAIVQLGFGVHPAQQACGKPDLSLEDTGFHESTEVQSEQCQQPDHETPEP